MIKLNEISTMLRVQKQFVSVLPFHFAEINRRRAFSEAYVLVVVNFFFLFLTKEGRRGSCVSAPLELSLSGSGVNLRLQLTYDFDEDCESVSCFTRFVMID